MSRDGWRVFRHGKAILGESPVWDAGHATLWWVDCKAHTVYASGRGSELTRRYDEPVGSVVLATAGRTAVLLGRRVLLVDRAGLIERQVATIPSPPGHVLNDAKADPFGNLVAGTIDLAWTSPTAALYRVSGTGEVMVLRDGLTISNGLDWSPDGSRIYFTDSAAGTVYTAEYRRDGLSDERVFAVVGDGMPDGLTVDRDGFVWVAVKGAGRVVRYAPDGGRGHEVRVPVQHLTSVAFGGAGLGTLFVTTACHGLDPKYLAHQPLTGSVLAFSPGAHGKPPYRFRPAEHARDDTPAAPAPIAAVLE